MDIRPIKTEADYEAALARIDELMDAQPDSPKGDELDILAILLESYEEKHHPINAPDPIEAIRFRMDQLGLIDRDLTSYIGSSGRISEILNYKRKLTLTMIRQLHQGLKIPTESLIEDYELNANRA